MMSFSIEQILFSAMYVFAFICMIAAFERGNYTGGVILVLVIILLAIMYSKLRG